MNLINIHLINQNQQKSTLLYNYMDTLINQLLVSFNKLLDRLLCIFDSFYNSLYYYIISKKKLYNGGRCKKLKFKQEEQDV